MAATAQAQGPPQTAPAGGIPQINVTRPNRALQDASGVAPNGAGPTLDPRTAKQQQQQRVPPSPRQPDANDSANGSANGTGKASKIAKPTDDVLGVPPTEDGGKLKRTTSSYSVNNEFIKPKEFTYKFPWKKIGSYVDSEKELTKEELEDLLLDSSANKLTTYIYEKYYADFYWNCSMIVGACFASWCFTYLGFGLFSLVFVLICTFAVYRAELRRFNINIRDDMQRIQSTENLEKKLESMEWLNNFLVKFWVIYMPALADLVISNTNQVLSQVDPPPPIIKLSLDEFTLGTKAPKIDAIRSFTKLGKDLYQMDWSLNFTPNDIDDMTQEELKNKIDPKIALGITIGKGIVHASLPILVENMSFLGNLRIRIKLGDTFPHIDIVSICFLEPPKIDYSLKPVGGNTLGIDVMSVIPGLSSFVNGLINSNLAPLMYYPNTIDIKPTELLQPPSAIGCLMIKVRAAEFSSSKTINPYIKYGPDGDLSKQHQTDIKSNTIVPIFNESTHILIDNLYAKLKFELFDLNKNGNSKLLGEAGFELQDLLQDQVLELNETKFTKKNKNVGKIVYDLKWYPVLQGEILPDGTKSNPPDSDTGIIELTIMSASDMDTSKSLVGKLSTYVEVYIDSKLIQTSRVVKGTNFPEYNFQVEDLIYSKTASILKLVVKDISSYTESIIAEYESKILDLTLIDNSGADAGKNRVSRDFTKGKGSLKFASVWKPLGSISGETDDDTTFVPPIGTFRVDVKSCTKLANVETLGTIDPYIEILSSGKTKGRTSTIKNSLNPAYDEEFFVPILSKNQKLRFNCMDEENKGKADRLIGDLILDISGFFNDPSKQNKTVSLSSKLTRNGKDVGTVNYALTYYPLLPVFSHQEIVQIKQKKAEAAEKAEDLDELEEQAKYLEDYKKHPDDYEWVDIDEEANELIQFETNKDKVILSLPEILQNNSGVLGINLISGTLKTKIAYVQATIDDHSFPDFISRKSKNGKLGSTSGECFIRDLRHSILNFRIVKNEIPVYKTDVLYETVDPFNVIDLLTKGFEEPIKIDLDGNKLEFLFEFVPSVDRSFETVEDTGLLEVNVISGSNLLAADRSGKSDPYVEGHLQDKQVFKTKIVKKTHNPNFGENFTIPVKSRRRQLLTFKVFDWDMAGENDPLGNVSVDLKNLPIEQEIVQDFKLDTQGSIKIGLHFKPGYIKSSNGTLLTYGAGLSPFNTGLNLATGAVGKAGGLATGAAGRAGGLATGAVGVVGGTAGTVGGIASGFTGGFSKLMKPFEETSGTNKEENLGSAGANSKQTHHSSHLKLKPSFLGGRSKRSESDAESLANDSFSRPSDVSAGNRARRVPSSTMLNDNGNANTNFNSPPPPNPNLIAFAAGGSPQQMRVPSSPGVINHDNYAKNRNSMDAVSVTTNAFSGTTAIAGRLSVLELHNTVDVKEALSIKVVMKSGNGTEKSIYKTKGTKFQEGMYKWHESAAFRCDSASTMIFSIRSHHTFGKSEEFGHGEILLEQVIGVKKNIAIAINGKISGSLVVNFNYA